jgi:protein-tyrosine sulfotransferase
MATSGGARGAPIFIVSHARTGSTLLRYIIDTHPSLCCPSEIALGQLCAALSYTLTLTHAPAAAAEPDAGSSPADAPTMQIRAALSAHAAVRDHVHRIMDAYCAAKNKRRWCDKSSNNVQHLDVLGRIFPEAQYLCLHRNGMDVTHSLLNLFRLGFPGRFGELVVSARGNVVDAMIDSWIEATEALLAFEAAHPAQCCRVTYEELVANPEPIVARIFEFLEEPFDAQILERVFSTAHDPGPGDVKIQYTSKIVPNRTGRGLSIPRNHISPDRLAKLNRLHAELGYQPVYGDEPAHSVGAVFAAAMQRGGVSMPMAPNHW